MIDFIIIQYSDFLSHFYTQLMFMKVSLKNVYQIYFNPCQKFTVLGVSRSYFWAINWTESESSSFTVRNSTKSYNSATSRALTSLLLVFMVPRDRSRTTSVSTAWMGQHLRVYWRRFKNGFRHAWRRTR